MPIIREIKERIGKVMNELVAGDLVLATDDNSYAGVQGCK